MGSIFYKEINAFLGTLVGYVVLLIFLIGTGLFLWVFPDTNVLAFGYADLSTLFSVGPYVFLFLIPAVTMRSFAEERKQGTLEVLLTKPVTVWAVVLGKYLASCLLVFIALLPTLIYVVSVYQLGDPVGNLDMAGLAGSYIGLFLLGTVFASIGIFASSLTDNQIISFITALVFCYISYEGFSRIASIGGLEGQALMISKIGMAYHFQALGKGLIDSRDLLYFAGAIYLMLSATVLKIKARGW